MLWGREGRGWEEGAEREADQECETDGKGRLNGKQRLDSDFNIIVKISSIYSNIK